MRTNARVLTALFLCISATGCGASGELSQLREENAALKSKLAKLEEQLASATASASSTTATATATDASATETFTDTKGAFGEKQINDLAKLGVFEPKTALFEPDKPITRALFVEWLVKSNNALLPDRQIRVAGGEEPKFPDVPKDHPQFKYIQGMANAGWSVGFDDRLFKPDKMLSREEMISIKTPVDVGKNLSDGDSPTIQRWSDYKKIGKRFFGALCWESSWLPNYERCFGKTKSLDPQKSVTRAEAAVCLWQFGAVGAKTNPDNYKTR